MIGRVFDNRYEVLRKLGAGGMAEVFLAHDRTLGRDVALKVLQSRFADDEQFVERFRREASNAAGLNHPNIVQIYDRGEAEGTYYIAMEYLEGRSLKEIIVRFAPLRSDHVVALSTQILEALRFAHRKDVIHRDIKPQNIIVDDEGRVKVTDFGIALAGSASRMTEVGSIIGTAHYLSPEQAQGEQAEAASDLYALGVVMYELATGKLPFDADNPVAIAMQHVGEPAIPPRTLAPDLDEDLERVILRALAKRPEQRYLTAAAFTEDLYRVQRGERVAPPPAFEAVAVDAGSFREQHTRVMGPGAFDELDLPFAVPADPTQLRPAAARRLRGPADEDALPFEPPRRSLWPWVLVGLFLVLLSVGVYLVVSTLSGGDEMAVVESLEGLTVEEATAKLEEAGLTLDVAGEEVTDTFEPGRIVRQDPGAGEKLRLGRSVSVWIATSGEKVELPDLVGKTDVQALIVLGQLGLQEEIRREPSEEHPEGVVYEQDPEAGSQVSVGSVVVLYVSSGPSGVQVELPDVVGMTQERALSLLGDEFGLTVKLLERDSDQEEGVVIEQFPKAGQMMGEGSTVTIYVSNGAFVPKVTVPNVIGEFKGPAGVKLGEAGLRVKVVEQPEEAYEPGKVFDQDPPAGSKIPKGSTVIIIVAKAVPTTTTSTTTTTTTTSTTTTSSSTTTTGSGSG